MSKNWHSCKCMTVTAEDNAQIAVTIGGCGGETKSVYTPGHDAKDKSLLIRAHRESKDILTPDGVASALAIAKAKGWESHILHTPKAKVSKAEGDAAKSAEAEAMVAEVASWGFSQTVTGAPKVATPKAGRKVA